MATDTLDVVLECGHTISFYVGGSWAGWTPDRVPENKRRVPCPHCPTTAGGNYPMKRIVTREEG
jgi:hypothetical protein